MKQLNWRDSIEQPGYEESKQRWLLLKLLGLLQILGVHLISGLEEAHRLPFLDQNFPQKEEAHTPRC
jgi:hypothetical protein